METKSEVVIERSCRYPDIPISLPLQERSLMMEAPNHTESNVKSQPVVRHRRRRLWLLIPLVVLILIVLAFSFLGDGIRDAFDPRSKD